MDAKDRELGAAEPTAFVTRILAYRHRMGKHPYEKPVRNCPLCLDKFDPRRR